MFDSSIGRTLLGGFLAGVAGEDPNQIAIRKATADAQIAESKAQTAAIQSKTEQTRAEQTSALQQLLSLGTSSATTGGFLSPVARGLVNRAANAEDPFADSSLLAQAPSALQSEALARITSTAVGGPPGAASALSSAMSSGVAHNLSLQGFQQLSDIAGINEQQRSEMRKQLFPTTEEQLTTAENESKSRLAIQKLGLAGSLLAAAQRGDINLTDLAQSRNVLLETAAQQLGIVESVRQLRGAMLDRYNISLQLDKFYRQQATQLLRSANLTGSFPVDLVAKAIQGGFGSLTEKQQKALQPLEEAISRSHTSALASQVGALADLPSQKVGTTLLNTALGNEDIETAQNMLDFLRKDAVNRLGPDAAQFYPQLQVQSKHFLGIPHGSEVGGLASPPPTGLSETEQTAYLLLNAAGGDPSAALDLARQRFSAATENGVSPAQRAAFQKLVKLLSDMKRSASSDAAGGGSE